MKGLVPRHQFYGRRKGHALRSRHLQLVAELLPKLRFDPTQFPSPQRKLGSRLKLKRDSGVRRNDERVWLEIGFGGGEHLAHQAELHPEINFIGAEPFLNGVAKLLALIEEKRLANIRIHDGDARYLLEALPDTSLERIYLLYPDPWPKIRHAKRRFVNAETLTHFHRLLKPAGLFLFASDIADYVDWTRQHVSAHGGFVEEGDPQEPFENWTQTRYEMKARRDGTASAYLSFRRR
ncbi:MAG TPA: tRNA (guanosine(46)-N7)-methyltransferase TrmB [Aestuariivirga sp.]|nr:tRNA (guanosine(46)-N7)-methyltransferase TrmB [Aestuariivirga sp.]